MYKHFDVPFHSTVDNEHYTVHCWVTSYEVVRGTYDIWDVSDVDYNGTCDIDFEIVAVINEEGNIILDKEFTVRELYEIERSLSTLCGEYKREEYQ